MNIENIEILEEAQKDIEKIQKKCKNFSRDFDKFKNVVLNADFEQAIHRRARKQTDTKCSNKSFYKYRCFWSSDFNDTKSFRIMYFIKDKVLYILEVYRKNKQRNPDYSRFQKYCDY